MLLCIKFQPDALYITIWSMEYVQEKFEDTKGVTRSRKSKNDRQCNGQKKKWQATIYTTLHRKVKIEQLEPR